MTRVCVTGSETSPKELESRLDQVLLQNPRVLCELRLDYLKMSPQQCLKFLKGLNKKYSDRLIITQRLTVSGPIASGKCDWSLQEWKIWWDKVVNLSNWFALDLDWIVLDQLSDEAIAWNLSKQRKCSNIFFSFHGKFSEVEKCLAQMLEGIRDNNIGIKIAVPVTGASDLARLADMSGFIGDFPLKTIVAMGDAGKAWRWSKLAGDITYVAYNQDSKTARGQAVWKEVAPYFDNKGVPELYVLWNADPNNTMGEKRWNRMFRTLALHKRYVSVVDQNGLDLKEKEKEEWASAALGWMKRAGIMGASVTRPFKSIFPLLISHDLNSINTIHRAKDDWQFSSTDGEAVYEILKSYNLVSKSSMVALLGSGGAATAVKKELERQELPNFLWTRDQDKLLIKNKNLDQVNSIVSTWPSHTQENLIAQLDSNYSSLARLELLIDAQFILSEKESPLAMWCRQKGVEYVSGERWWQLQARKQASIWLDKDCYSDLLNKLCQLLPRSKSETIRALAIALIRKEKTIIEFPSICDDTIHFKNSITKLGAKIKLEPGRWIIEPPASIRPDSKEIQIGESATGLRFLSALSCVMEKGFLLISAQDSLRNRPMDELFESLNIKWDKTWPLRIPTACPIPNQISLAQTSQFASGFLIAACAKNEDVKIDFLGEQKSWPYLELTKSMLCDAGFSVRLSNKYAEISKISSPENMGEWKTEIQVDASGLAFLEVLVRYLSFGSLYPHIKNEVEDKNNLQGDFEFLKFLDQLIAVDEVEISLRNHPDLAPPLWAAAVLFQKKLNIINTPQLRIKECDRAQALAQASLGLGFASECREDGLRVDASLPVNQNRQIFLNTHNDHRMAMAFAVAQFRFPKIEINNKECVNKSFVTFWTALQLIRNALL